MNTLNRWFLAIKIRFLTIRLHDICQCIRDAESIASAEKMALERLEIEMKLRCARADYYACLRRAWKQV